LSKFLATFATRIVDADNVSPARTEQHEPHGVFVGSSARGDVAEFAKQTRAQRPCAANVGATVSGRGRFVVVVVFVVMRLWCLCLAAGLLHAVRCSTQINTLNILRAVSAVDDEWYSVLVVSVRVDRDNMDESVTSMLNDDLTVSEDTVQTQKVVSYLVTHPDSTTNQQILFGMDVLGKAVSCLFTYTLAVHSFIVFRHGNENDNTEFDFKWYLSNMQVALVGYIKKLEFFDRNTKGYVEIIQSIDAILKKNYNVSDDNDKIVEKDEIIRFLDDVVKKAKEWATKDCGVSEGRQMIQFVKLKNYNKQIYSENWKEMKGPHVATIVNDFEPYEFIMYKDDQDLLNKFLKITVDNSEGQQTKTTTTNENEP